MKTQNDTLSVSDTTTNTGAETKRVVIIGAGFGAINVSANAQGLALERLSGRSILSSFHAAFSAGGLTGAGLGAFAAGARLGPSYHFGILVAALLAIGLVSVRFLLPPDADDQAKSRTFARPPRAIFVAEAETKVIT